MRTTIALMLLTGPPLCLFARYVREHGLTFRNEKGWGVFPVLALILLFVYVAMTLSPEVVQILNAEHFPSRGFMIFLVTGVAFSVAMFPQLSAETTESLPKAAGINLEWIIAFPAWIWIVAVLVLAVLKFGS